MRPVNRRVLFPLALGLPGIRHLPALLRAEPATRLYVGNAARLTAEIPGDWTVGTSTIGSVATFDYQGTDGFVVSLPLVGPTLDEAAASVVASPRFAGSEATVVETTWSGQPARRVDGQIDGLSASALVVPHPHPFDLYGERMVYAALIADSNSSKRISATLSFARDRVSPQDYVTSLIELVEARAYWSAGVDWDAAREQARIDVAGLIDPSQTQGAIANIVGHLTGAGDEHSHVASLEQASAQGETAGVGLLIGDRRVLVVYPDGPAARVGVRAGDLIEAVDGRRFFPTLNVSEPSALWGITVQLALRRAGVAEPITVTVEQGPYTQFSPPTGRCLAGDLGYIELFQFNTPEREADYVTTARSVIAAIDESPTHGWVIDLRLNLGGSYPPMVAGVGPILGNGTFLGWRWPDDRQSWVTYADSRILDGGNEVAGYPNQTDGALHLANSPVAVLTGPLTASSGEVATLAFVGRPETRRFGAATAGLTTGNVGYPLFDGAVLFLAEVAMTDRSGMTHLEGIEPDVPIPFKWKTYGTEADPVLQAAIAWLNQQPAPGDATPTP